MRRTAMRFARWVAAGVLSAAVLAGCARQAEEVVVYSSRNEQLIRPLLDEYEAQTGVHVALVTDKEGPLIERLASEGPLTPADVLLTVDAGNLWYAKTRGLLAPLDSPALTENIPPHLRDPDGHWFGLSVRARTVVYNKARVAATDLTTYEALAEPSWQGRLCLRTSKKVYNQSLVAMLIAQHGEARAQEIVEGWVENLATKVFASDNQVIEAVAAGQCDVGIVNTYYYGRLLRDDADLPVGIAFVNQGAGGVHVNVSGAGVTRHAPNPQGAQALLEWLSQGEAQQLFAAVNLEYPANPNVAIDPFVASWGRFEANPINVAKAGELQSAAVRLMDRAGYR